MRLSGAKAALVKRFTKTRAAQLGTVQGMPQALPPTAAVPAAHDVKDLSDWIEIFRAGHHVDSKGRPCSFTQADLDQVVMNNAKLGPAPLVLGHPKHDDPSFGWTHELKREGDSLFMKAGEVHPDFAASVKSGAYRNRSVHVFPDKAHGWRLRHVGWLGAAAPAIDLTPIRPAQFAAPEEDGFEFASDVSAWDVSSALEDLASLLRGQRERLIATEGLEVANEALPEWRLASITATAARIREAGNATHTTPRLFNNPTGAGMSLTQADLDRTAAETEARVRAELGSQFTASTAELAQLKAERQRERIAAQITGWKAAGLLLPAEEPGLAEFMAALEGAAEASAFEFTASTGQAPTKKSPGEYFAEFVAARGALVKLAGPGGANNADTTDLAPKVDASDYQAIARAANEFQAAEAKAGREIGIDAAVAHVIRNV
jgi:hypothetical protein